LNRAEVMFRTGTYISAPRFPARPGYEAAGTVTAIGDGVSGFKIGDAVSVIPGFDPNDYGFYGDLANAPAPLVVHHASSLSWIQAASIWMQYLTAYGALIEIAGLQSGEVVVIPAASSSVGLAAIQITNRMGATPIALTRGRSKQDRLIDAGAKHVISTDEEDVVKEIMAITGGKGARIVFDPVGGPAVEKLTNAMSRFGILFIYGTLSTEATPLPLFDLLSKNLTIRGYILYEVTNDPEKLERGTRFINVGLADGSLKPIIDKIFPLEEIVEAHRYLESNQQFGKIVVTV
jgi:NADPH:quinone reductase